MTFCFHFFYRRFIRYDKLNFAYLRLLRYTFWICFPRRKRATPHAPTRWIDLHFNRGVFINSRRSFPRYFHINALTNQGRETRTNWEILSRECHGNCFQMLQGVRSRRGRAVRWPVRFLRKLRRWLTMRHQKFAAQHPGGGRRSLHEWVESWLLFSYLLALHLSLVFANFALVPWRRIDTIGEEKDEKERLVQWKDKYSFTQNERHVLWK